MKKSTMKYQAKKLISKLKRMNYTVSASKKGATLLINVDAPVRELEGISIEITERVNGMTRRIRAARYAGCCVVWEA